MGRYGSLIKINPSGKTPKKVLLTKIARAPNPQNVEI